MRNSTRTPASHRCLMGGGVPIGGAFRTRGTEVTVKSLRYTLAPVTLAVLLAACGNNNATSGAGGAPVPTSPGSGTHTQTPHSKPSPSISPVPAQQPVPAENNPPGDIPDNTQFVPY